MSGKVVGQGRFRVDRKKALDKIEKFQLEDPRRYVVELLAAAVAAGATAVDIYNDSDDFIFSFDTEPLTGEELDGLFDHVFGKPDTPRASMLQHLGIAVLGALGLQPRWVHVDSGSDELALRVTVTDPAETKHVALDEVVEGVRVHVRERVSLHQMGEALRLLFREPDEAQLVRGSARQYPVPLTINGVPFEAERPPNAVVLDLKCSRQRACHLMLVPELGRQVDLVRHGVVVGRRSWSFGRLAVTGWIDVSDLRLNASRARLVNDAAHKRANEEMESLVQRLLVEGLESCQSVDEPLSWQGARGPMTETRGALLDQAALEVLWWLGVEKLGVWANRPVLEDWQGHRWSIQELREHEETPCWSKVGVVPGWTRPTFRQGALKTLSAMFELDDVSADLEVAREGHRRRMRASDTTHPTTFLQGEYHVFECGNLRGSVQRRAGMGRRMRLRLQIEGVVVETIERPSTVGGIDAIVDHPDFATDLGFRHVLKDGAFAEALAVLNTEALAYAEACLSEASSRPESEDAAGWLCEILDSRAQDAAGLVTCWPWCDLPAVPCANGHWRSPSQVVNGVHTLYFVASDPGLPEALAEDILLLRTWMRLVWKKWLGDRLEPGDGVVEQRHQRLARLQNVEEPVYTGPLSRRWQVDGGGIHGELGVFGSGVRILRNGFFVCELSFSDRLPNLCGVIEVGEVRVDEAHQSLENEAAVRQAITTEVDAFARAWWTSLDADALPPPALVAWLTACGKSGLDEVLAARPVARRLGGERITAGEAVRTGKKKGSSKFVMVRSDPRLPGFDHAVVEDGQVGALLRSLANDRVRDGSNDVADARNRAKAFEAQPLWVSPRVLARMPVSGRNWEGQALLLADPGQVTDLEVVALHEGRVLARRYSHAEPGVLLVVHGPGVRPNRRYTDVTDSKLVTRLKKQAAKLFVPLVEQAASQVTPEHLPAFMALLFAMQAHKSAPFVAARTSLMSAPMIRTVQGELISPTELLSRIEAEGPVHEVSEGIETGVAEGLFVRENEWLGRWFHAQTRTKLLPGDAVVTQQRARMERVRLEQRREPRLGEANATPFDEGGRVGEVMLTPAAEGPAMLVVQPLVDGIAMEVVRIPWVVSAKAIVEGRGVRADETFKTVLEDVPWKSAILSIKALCQSLIRAHLEASDTVDLWALRCALTFPKLGDVPILPDVHGVRWSRHQMKQRAERSGGVGVVTQQSEQAAKVLPGSPLVVSAEAVEVLRAHHIPCVVLDSVLKTPRRERLRVVHPLTGSRTGALGVVRHSSASVEVTYQGIVWTAATREDRDGLLPLAGRIEDPEIVPSEVLELQGCDEKTQAAWERFQGWLAAEERTILRGLMQSWESGERPSWLGLHLRAALGILVRRVGPDLAADPDAPRLAALPLFTDHSGAPLSLNDLWAMPVVYAAPPQKVRPRPPGHQQVVALEAVAKSWLSDILEIRDGDAVLADQAAGLKRRQAEAQSTVLPLTRFAASCEWEDRTAAGWLTHDFRTHSFELRVEDRRVCQLDLGIPGLDGWLNGDFETNATFTKATPSDADLAQVGGMVRDLLQKEWDGDPDSAMRRLIRAVGLSGLKPLVRRQPAWASLQAFSLWEDGVERSLSLDGMAALDAGALVVVAQGETLGAGPFPARAVGPMSLTSAKHLFPSRALFTLRQWRQKTREEEAVRARAALAKSEKQRTLGVRNQVSELWPEHIYAPVLKHRISMLLREVRTTESPAAQDSRLLAWAVLVQLADEGTIEADPVQLALAWAGVSTD